MTGEQLPRQSSSPFDYTGWDFDQINADADRLRRARQSGGSPLMTPYARCERLWRDVGDDSPWYEKALFHALGALEHGDDPEDALRKIEASLAERPQEVDPSIYEREAQAILDAEDRDG